jgi:hypothetical protein
MPKQVKTKAIVVLVHGSGPNDMDETIGPNKVFFQLAHLLAEHGIASLRYDKRTYLLQQDTTIPSFAATLSNVVVNDAVAAGDFVFSIDSLQQYPMFVVGHSLGAHSVPFIISQSTHFQGGIMLAGNARPLEDIVLEQYKYLFSPGGLSKDEKNEIKRIQKQVKEVKKLEKLLEKEKSPSLPLTNDTNFWLSLNRYNALEVASSIRKPLLIVQGERDYQVTTVDFALWKKQLFAISNGNYVRNPGDSDPIDFVQLHQNGVDFILYPTLNHLFMTGSEASFPEEYNRKGNVSAILVSDMANWLQRQLR